MPAPPAPTPFRCDVIPEGARVRVMPAGEVDLTTTPALERTMRELLESRFDHIVLDLANVEFIDSSGLHLILALTRSAESRGSRLRLRPGPPSIQRLFELTETLALIAFEAPARRPRRVRRRR